MLFIVRGKEPEATENDCSQDTGLPRLTVLEGAKAPQYLH